jgi:hypothetical protein
MRIYDIFASHEETLEYMIYDQMFSIEHLFYGRTFVLWKNRCSAIEQMFYGSRVLPAAPRNLRLDFKVKLSKVC